MNIQRKHLSMTWMQYENPDDMVTRFWILEHFDIQGISDQIKSLLKEYTRSWKVKLTGRDVPTWASRHGKGYFPNGISFQMVLVSPLISVRCLIPLTHLRNAESGCEFPINARTT